MSKVRVIGSILVDVALPVAANIMIAKAAKKTNEYSFHSGEAFEIRDLVIGDLNKIIQKHEDTYCGNSGENDTDTYSDEIDAIMKSKELVKELDEFYNKCIAVDNVVKAIVCFNSETNKSIHKLDVYRNELRVINCMLKTHERDLRFGCDMLVTILSKSLESLYTEIDDNKKKKGE